MTAIRLPNGWRPRPYQMPAWQALEQGCKRLALAWHRRAGKDEVCLHWTAVAAHQRVAPYWHMLPQANQARKAIWDAVNPHTGRRRIDEAFPNELRATTREQEMFIKFKNGSTWQVVGSDNFNSLVGSPPAGLASSEHALANPSAWSLLRPILAENGGWLMAISTPRGRNHFAKMVEFAEKDPNWFGQRLSVETTRALPEAVLAQELRELINEHGPEAGQAIYDQEYRVSFEAPNLGAIYGRWIADAEREGRIRHVEFDPALPVHTGWDLGFDDATAIWFYQMAGMEVRFIDYYEMSGYGIDHFCEMLEKRSQECGYRYGKHNVPHDAANKLQAAGGRSIVAQAYQLGVKMEVVPATSQQNSIQALRTTLPHAWFDAEKCEEGIEAMRDYHFEWDEDRKVFSEKPAHTWSSHAADAAEIVGRVWRKEKSPAEKPKPKFLEQMTANELFWPRQQPQRSERV